MSLEIGMNERRSRKTKILIVDDEPGITLGLADQLEMEGYDVLVRSDGISGLEAICTEKPDLVLLDVMMPRMDGYEVCRRIRKEDDTLPILMLTAKGDEVDKVVGLEFGADDYVTKPFGLRELVARIRAILRRIDRHEAEDDQRVAAPRRLTFGDVDIDFVSFEGLKRGKPIDLTPREFRILQVFAARPGEVISRDEFLQQVWGEDVYVTTRSVDNQVSSIRKKVGDDGENPRYFVTIRTVGYKFIPD